MERLTEDLFKPLTQTESKRLVGGVAPPVYCLDRCGTTTDGDYLVCPRDN